MAVGLAALPGAAAFGLLWQFRGAPFALCSAATLTALTALVLLRRAPR